MSSHRLVPVEPTLRNEKKIARSLWIVRWPLIWILRFFYKLRLTWSGTESLPKDKPFLLLTNHTNLVDPFLLYLALGRPIHFMATQSSMDNSPMGRVVRYFGSVPKKKFVSDPTAIRMMRRWSKLGTVTGLFPEGERSWDGRLLELLPGLDKLIKLSGVPVVTGRVINASYQFPRWAHAMRQGRVHIEFDPPQSFKRDDSPEFIIETIRSRLTVDHSQGPRWPLKGDKLAHGLSNAVFACPDCMAIDSLEENGNLLSCSKCQAGWALDSSCTMTRLHPLDAKSPTVHEAIDAIREHYAVLQANDSQRLDAEGLVLESQPMRWIDATGTTQSVIGDGVLKLYKDRLEFVSDDQSVQTIPLCELMASSVEVRRRLQFRTQSALYEAAMPRESVVKWFFFTEMWRKKQAAADNETAVDTSSKEMSSSSNRQVPANNPAPQV